jgi:hypothetical protein
MRLDKYVSRAEQVSESKYAVAGYELRMSLGGPGDGAGVGGDWIGMYNVVVFIAAYSCSLPSCCIISSRYTPRPDKKRYRASRVHHQIRVVAVAVQPVHQLDSTPINPLPFSMCISPPRESVKCVGSVYGSYLNPRLGANVDV